jgi:hypothetical protein
MPTDLDRAREAVVKASRERLAEAYRKYHVEELDWDWGCKILAGSREILRAEYARRGICPGLTGRGRRRDA